MSGLVMKLKRLNYLGGIKMEKKPGVYFLMPDEEPNIDSFMRMAHELYMLNFDDSNFQRVMILTPKQMTSFLTSISKSLSIPPSHGNFHTWIFAGFMIRTLYGTIE